MKEAQTQTTLARQAYQKSSRWYLATTLAERVALLQNIPSSISATDQVCEEKARESLLRWKNQPPFQKVEGSFAQRLIVDSLTEEGLFTLLAQSAEALQRFFPVPPAWLTTLNSAFEHQDTPCLPIQQINDPNIQAVFQAIKPLLNQGYARLNAGIEGLQKCFARLPFDPQNIGLLLFPYLFDQLSSKLTKTLVLELNVARVQERLQGKTPEQRFTNFLQQLAQPEPMLTLLEEYPVLARQMVETIDRWLTCKLEFLQHLCADWDELRNLFASSGNPGLLCEIHEGAGDPHRNGHSVTTLTWNSGLRLVYKPRSLAIDTHFQEFLTWFNDHGHQPAFRTLTVLDKQTHGWYEFVAASSCTSTEEIDRFYQRQGSYLAILYTLEATDFHAENLLASGEDPMLIDLETLFHPRFNALYDSDVNGYALINHSVLRPGLLPHPGRGNPSSPNVDMSGLTAHANRVSVTGWQGLGTDELRASKEQIELQVAGHRPDLQGQTVEAQQYETSIIAGFTRTYKFLIQHREAILAELLPRFAHDTTRVLLRPTQQYLKLKTDAFHPKVLRDALERDRLFDRLWIGTEYIPALAPVVAAERADLWNEDIPAFTTFPASYDLITSQGKVIPGFFQEASLVMAIKRLQALDENDLERQCWLIRATMARKALNTNTVQKRGLLLQPASEPATWRKIQNALEAIGKRLYTQALVQPDTIDWLNLHLRNGHEWTILPLGMDLYSGLSGIALFLAYLGQITNDQQHTSMARLTLQTILSRLQMQEQDIQWGSIGAFNGAGSLIYLFSHLGLLWHEPDLYREAEKIVAQLSALIAKDELLDVMGGTAGCIAVLLSLYTVAPSPQTLTVALQCGDHLLSHARPMKQGIGWITKGEEVPLTGLAHGNAGMALNLLRLAAVSKEERFHKAALEALAYERALFLPDQQNWPDLRTSTAPQTTSDQQEPSCMVAWCHGASGIGLARLASIPYHNDSAMQEELNAALQTLLSEGFGGNHSLCHGDLGNLEILQALTQYLAEPDLQETIESLKASLLENLVAQGWRSGIPGGCEVPGLMLGLAGTGYALLRQLAPERVPSVLLLAPPQAANA